MPLTTLVTLVSTLVLGGIFAAQGWRPGLLRSAPALTSTPAQDAPRFTPAPRGVPRRAATASWWVPAQGASWQIQYTGEVDTRLAVDVYNLDGEDTPQETAAALRSRGVRTICYINAGAWEDWRSDRARFPDGVLGRAMEGWAGERWLDIRRTDVLLPLMRARMAMCAAKGFDAVDADNVMGYQEGTGFPLTAAHQLAYNRALAGTAHSLGLGFGLKNDSDQLAQLLPHIDFAVNEECLQDGSCGAYRPLLAQGKAVFHVEYGGSAASVCAARPRGFSTLLKERELGNERRACPVG